MRLFAALAAILMAGCATLPAVAPESECRQRFEQLDARVDAAGVRDGGEHRVKGFPYLRVNRFLASFRNEMSFAPWVEQLRQLDLKARRIELKNLGAPFEYPALDRCGRELVRSELGARQVQATLRERAQVPDDYSTAARMTGLYPLAVPFLGVGIDAYQDSVRARFAKPLAEVMTPPRTEYRLAAGAAASLIQTHAPIFSVATHSDSDRIGTPTLESGFDASQPVVYFQRSETRFGDRVLPQLVYTAWFPERPARGVLDPYSGTLDAVVWRVTLDERNRPLAYDTIHACGCYHLWFPAQPLKFRENLSESGDPPLVPQSGLAPKNPVLVLDSDTHFVSRIIPAEALKSQKSFRRVAREPESRGARLSVERAMRRLPHPLLRNHRVAVAYKLRPYSDLLTLEDGDGRTRSLFDQDGIVRGSERGERWWLWVSGIRSPGAMRQSGRHATAFIGRRHFDDARVLESVFVP